MSEEKDESQWYQDSKELGKTFFDRWSILSGGTFTLLIPFIQSLDGNIKYPVLLVVIESILLVALLTSSLHSWIASEISYYNSLTETDEKDEKMQKFYVVAQRINHRVAIFSYPIAVVLLLIFINSNIF